MKHVVFFSISLLFCLQLQAQWSVYDSGKEYQVLVSTAQGQPAIYKNIPCEVKLVSLKNKILKLTSSNATVTPNTEAGSYSIQTSDENAVLQIYSVKKSKMKLLKEIQIRTVDVPFLDELTLYGKNLSVGYSYSLKFDSGYESSPYDQQVFSKNYSVESWAFSCPAARKNFYGSGNQLSQEVTSFLRYLPEGVSYEIIAYHNGPIKPGDYQPNVMQAFNSQNTELPGAKYVILNNTPQNKAWFDEKDQSSLIGMLNNNYGIQATITKPWGRKSTSQDGEFLEGNLSSSLLIDGIDSERLNSGKLIYDEFKNPFKLKTFSAWDPTMTIGKTVYNSKTGYGDSVYWLNSYVQSISTLNPYEPKLYLSTDSNGPYNIDAKSETTDKSLAFIDTIVGLPVPVFFTTVAMAYAYTTDSIQQIIIRYDSVLNISTGAIEIQPTRISLARKFGKNDLADVVFSMKVKDLVKFQSYAPTIQLKNDKTNATFFDLENPKSLLGYLNSKTVRESGIGYFPYLNNNGPQEFGDDCDPNGKVDQKLLDIKETIRNEWGPNIKLDGSDTVYIKKGLSTEPKFYLVTDKTGPYTIDPTSETTDPSEAEIIPGTDQPYPVEYLLKDIMISQYKGLTDLFIKRKYLYDPTYGVYVAKPTTIGFAQQMPGQTKPTLIMQVDLTSDPKLLSMLPKMQSQLFLGQPWAMSLLQNEVESMGETIDASNIPALQKKFQFRKKMVTLGGEMELVNEPHF
jgi:hypothetical protein